MKALAILVLLVSFSSTARAANWQPQSGVESEVAEGYQLETGTRYKNKEQVERTVDGLHLPADKDAAVHDWYGGDIYHGTR